MRLSAMVAALYQAVSATPEEDFSKGFTAFVLEHKLHTQIHFLFFGFNNPNPSGENPVCGYEIWVTMPKEFDVPSSLKKNLQRRSVCLHPCIYE